MCVSVHVTSETYLAENLEKMGSSAMTRENEGEIGRWWHTQHNNETRRIVFRVPIIASHVAVGKSY